jgi:hypothetical protein
MPSQGYFDAKTMLFNIYKENLLNPWHSKIVQKQTMPFNEMKEIVLNSSWVKQEMEKLVKKKM